MSDLVVGRFCGFCRYVATDWLWAAGFWLLGRRCLVMDFANLSLQRFHHHSRGRLCHIVVVGGGGSSFFGNLLGSAGEGRSRR